MPHAPIDEKAILDELHQIPMARWTEVWTFIRSLRPSLKETTVPRPVVLGTDLVGSDLIGIWADRPEIVSGREFARHLRRQAEQR